MLHFPTSDQYDTLSFGVFMGNIQLKKIVWKPIKGFAEIIFSKGAFSSMEIIKISVTLIRKVKFLQRMSFWL